MRRALAGACLTALGVLGAPAGVHAQAATASLVATTRIDNTAVTVGQLNNLDFGLVVPGTPTTIAPKAATAGKFVVHGTKNAEVRITFALPGLLQRGAFTMPISFTDDPVAGRMGCHRNQDQQQNCTAFTPSAPLLIRIRNNPPPQNTYFVWIGGKVSPALGQAPGLYTGTVTLTAVYTGN